MSGLNPELKSARFANYIKTLRKEIVELTHACNYEHPSQMTMHDIEVEVDMGEAKSTQSLESSFGYEKTPVPFVSVKELLNCPYLGGLGQGKGIAVAKKH